MVLLGAGVAAATLQEIGSDIFLAVHNLIKYRVGSPLPPFTTELGPPFDN